MAKTGELAPGTHDNRKYTSFELTAADLNGTERVVAFQLFQAKARADPQVSRAANMPFEHIGILMRMMTAKLELRLTKIDGSLNRLEVQLERDELYVKLLNGGVPVRVLRRHFAKSRRDIERDRLRAGVAAKNKGRPPEIDIEKQYEIAGHWVQLEAEAQDPAKRLHLLLGLYPGQSMAAICRIIDALEA